MSVLLSLENDICRCASDPAGKKRESFAKSPAIEVWKTNGMAGGGGVEALEDATAMLGGKLSLLLAPSSLSGVGWGHAVEIFLVCEERPCTFWVRAHHRCPENQGLCPSVWPDFGILKLHSSHCWGDWGWGGEGYAACCSLKGPVGNYGAVKICIRMANLCLQEILPQGFYASSAESIRKLRLSFNRRMLALTHEQLYFLIISSSEPQAIKT